MSKHSRFFMLTVTTECILDCCFHPATNNNKNLLPTTITQYHSEPINISFCNTMKLTSTQKAWWTTVQWWFHFYKKNKKVTENINLRYLNSLINFCLYWQGKLGHGDTNRVYKPKVIEGLQGLVIKKVCCGSQFSLALTSTGLVSVYGCIALHCT